MIVALQLSICVLTYKRSNNGESARIRDTETLWRLAISSFGAPTNLQET